MGYYGVPRCLTFITFFEKKLTKGILPNTSEKLMGQNWSISALYSRGKVLQYKKAFVCMLYVGIQPLYI